MSNGLHLFQLLFIWSYELLQQPTSFSNAEFPLFVTWKIGKDQRLRGETKISWSWTWGFLVAGLAKACNKVISKIQKKKQMYSFQKMIHAIAHVCVFKHQAALGPSMTWSCIMVWGSMPSPLLWRIPGESLATSGLIQAQTGLLGSAPWPEKSSLAFKCLCLSFATLRFFYFAALNSRYVHYKAVLRMEQTLQTGSLGLMGSG